MKQVNILQNRQFIAASYLLIYSLHLHSQSRTNCNSVMNSSICAPVSHSLLKHKNYGNSSSLFLLPAKPLTSFSTRRSASLTTRALLSTTKEAVLKDFHAKKAIKVKISIASIVCVCMCVSLKILLISSLHFFKLVWFTDYLRLAEF